MAQYDKEASIITLKFFYFHSNAELYSARLRDAGIDCFISNTHTTTMLPIGQGGIGLHVKEKDRHQAFEIIKEMDKLNSTEPDMSFHDADKEDIAYEKALHEGKNDSSRIFNTTLIALLIFILLLGVVAGLRYF